MRQPLVVTVETDAEIEPIPVLLQDVRGEFVGGGPFRFHPQPRLDLIAMMANAVTLNVHGDRIVDPTILTHVLGEMLMGEVWSDHIEEEERTAIVAAMTAAHEEDQKRPERARTGAPPPPALPGWLPVEDQARFAGVISGDRYLIRMETLGQILMHLLIEVTGHPTGGSLPFSGGPSSTTPGSTASSPAEAMTGTNGSGGSIPLAS